MPENENLKPGAQLLWAEALRVPERYGHKETCLNHLLLALLERHGSMAESLAAGLNASEYRNRTAERLSAGELGKPVDLPAILHEATDQAKREGQEKVSERHLAAEILKLDGWTLLTEPEQSAADLNQHKAAEVPAHQAAEPSEKTNSAPEFRPRAKHPTPLLDQFGTDLCRDAEKGKLTPILGRDLEIEGVVSTLCRWTKRNPLLVGPAGVGKTAIIEGLAQRVVRGDVPAPIQGIRIIALQPTSLISGLSSQAQYHERLEALLLEASQEGIVLFIDEVHSIVGSGGAQGLSDLATVMKPALAKGEIACIGATTDAEFRQFIEPDRALERRFRPLRVQELSRESTLAILESLRERASRERNVRFSDDALQMIVLLSHEYLRNRFFPDKAIDVLEQCVAHAMLNKVEEVTPAVVRDVVQRMVGMPIALDSELTDRLAGVRTRLITEAFCPESVAEEVVSRLEVTMRGLDITPSRPNAVLLLASLPGQAPELTGLVLADALYGSTSRIIEVDMTHFVHPADVNWLSGAPPGYVGHNEPLPFQLALAQQPWSVILFKSVDASHPQAQQVLAQAFRSGYFTDSRGDKIYLSNATVVLTVTAEAQTARRLGFGSGAGEPDLARSVAATDISTLLVPELLAEIDVSWSPARPDADSATVWIERWLLPPVSERYERHGLRIEWDPSVTRWLADAIAAAGDPMLGTQLLEEQVLPLLIPHMKAPSTVVVSRESDGSVRVTLNKGGGHGVPNQSTASDI